MVHWLKTCAGQSVRPRRHQGMSPRMSIFLDNAIAACSFQSAAQLCGLFRGREGTDKRPIVNAPGTEIGPAYGSLAAAKLVGILRLQHPKSGLSLAFTALRRNLNGITTA